MKEYLGTCVYKIKGLNTERLVNEFLKNKINILHFEKQNEYMIFKCNYYDSNKVKKLLKNYEILATEYNGICSLFHFIKKRFVLLILVGLCAVIIIFAVMFQTSSGQDATAITGATDSYYLKNKGTSIEDKLNKLTKIVTIVMVVLIVLYFVSRVIYKG